jgi:hypothetical protein
MSMMESMTTASLKAHRLLGVSKMPFGKLQVIESASLPRDIVPMVMQQVLRITGGFYTNGATEIEQQEITEALAKYNSSQLQIKVNRQVTDLAYATDENGNHAFLHPTAVASMKDKYKTYRMAKAAYDYVYPALGSADLSAFGPLQDVEITGTEDLTYDQLPKAFTSQAGVVVRNSWGFRFDPQDRGYRPRIPPSP